MGKYGVPSLAGLLLVWALPALAEPADYVYDPIVEQGEKEIDFKYGSRRLAEGTLNQGASVGFGYGAAEHWFTEFYAKFARSGPSSGKFDAFEWENKFQLTETGRYPVDLGFIAEIEVTHAPDDPNEFRYGPLLRAEFGRWQMNANALFTKTFGANGDAKPQLGYQGQAKYRWHREVEFGVQAFGEAGSWDHWLPKDERTFNIGPAVFGKLNLAPHQYLTYNAAWLLGRTPATPGHTFRMQVEYEY